MAEKYHWPNQIICSIVEEDNPADKILAVPAVKKIIKVLNKVPKESYCRQRFLFEYTMVFW
ncbi:MULTISPECIES: hypothetical protein [Caldanaerobacter]|uniref:hypothetical protein n=1 Tax=Caldanaerobacter TaxID=249529 RepID=UPI00241D404B|nr:MULTISPECIES: hypothetical protein [Caldanaerobacter]